MKKLIIALILGTAAFSAAAQHRGHDWHGGHHGHRHGSRDWVAPLIVGGIAGAIIARESQRSEAPVIVQPPVVVHNPRVVVPSNIIYIDGVPYTRQVVIIDGVYREVLVRY